MDYKAFGRRVRERRKEKHFTQESLAEIVGVSASFMGHIERGSRIASLETLVGLCNALHASPNYLLFGVEDTCEELSASKREELILLLESALNALKMKGE